MIEYTKWVGQNFNYHKYLAIVNRQMLFVVVMSFVGGILLGFGMGKWQVAQPSIPPTEWQMTPMPTPAPTPYVFTQYHNPLIPKKDHYTIFFVGDSMTEAMGPHPSLFSDLINAAYPTTRFVIDNYSVGGQNVTSLSQLLNTPKEFPNGMEKEALKRDFDILVIESFGHNPLSDFELTEGLSLQDRLLTKMMTTITRDHPQAVVIFLATIGPSDERYGDGLLNLTPELKAGYVRERKAYIENHIAYAQKHGIPLLNLYASGREADGTVKLSYLRESDHLHPSQEGIEWIQSELAKFVIENGFLKQ